MKILKTLYILSLIISCYSCSNNDAISSDPSADGEYILDNQSSFQLKAAFNSEFYDDTEIIPSESKTILMESFFGATRPIKPSSALHGAKLMREDNGTFTTVLEFHTIEDDAWAEEEIATNNSKFTLTVTDDMLN